MRIGIDLGGTKIEALALAPDGREDVRLRVPTPRGSYDEVVAAVVALVRETERRCGRTGSVGVGIPGTISPATGLVKNANTTMLIGHPLDRDLAAGLGRPVRVANDANCFALSEAVDGAAMEARPHHAQARPWTVFGVILGTGTGAGIVVGGWVVEGPDGVGGEWGHNPLPWPEATEFPGPACWCGLHGCLETHLSGPGMSRDHREKTGEELTATEIATAAARGDEAARATLRRYESRLARGLASIINVLNPDVIVLGGGVSNIDTVYENVPDLWSRFVFSDVVSTRLVRARHGDSSGVRGAAWLWPEDRGARP